ncbi:MAG: hypothetical protein MZU84_07430 [Sphingobacterium sp.]|nr:hypothetical protein [Sphingobacterium sp.]
MLSVDATRTVADGRFYQADMERLEGIDTLIFLDCEHGTVFALDERELIGKSIDLLLDAGERRRRRIQSPSSL